MFTATILLLIIGVVGAVDIAWFHTWKGRLVLRPESRREAWIHVARGFVYAAQFLVIPNLVMSGAWLFALLALFVVDAAIAAADVLEEPRSRAAQGGLCGGEYAMHVFLSVLVGALLCSVALASWPRIFEPSALHWGTEVPPALTLVALGFALGSAAVATIEALVLLAGARPEPIHVAIRLPASLPEVWDLTQDHRLHPSWDHRFSRITLCHEDARPHDGPRGTPDPRIRRGTLMRYERSLLGVVIRGFGRYKHHRPMQQSTFEFWSDDPRSLISAGAGLWRYLPIGPKLVEFRTSYDYRVRWGIAGRLFDRFCFRPLLRRVTEQSFRRLAREHFA